MSPLSHLKKYRITYFWLLFSFLLIIFDIVGWYFFQVNYRINQDSEPNLKIIQSDSGSQIPIYILENNPSQKRFRINLRQKTRITSNLPFSTNWQGFVNRIPVKLSSSEKGLLVLSVPSGHNEVEFQFQYNRIQKIGFLLVEFGLLSIILYLSFHWFLRIKSKKELLLSFVSTILILLVAEIIVRKTTGYQFAQNCFQLDKTYHHVLIPNKTCTYSAKSNSYGSVINSINAYGLRDDNTIKSPKPNKEFRILMLGDSFTTAMNLDLFETYSKQLEQMLNMHYPQLEIDVINAGVPSYSPLLEYLYLKDKGIKLEPDLVILNLDISDIADEVRYYNLAHLDSQGNILAVNEIPDLIPLHKKINFHFDRSSRLYDQYIYPKIFKFYSYLFKKKPVSIAENLGNFELDITAILNDKSYPDPEIPWFWLKKSLRLVLSLCQENQIPLLIGLYPYPPQVNGREWQTRSNHGFALGKVYSTEYFSVMERFAESENLPVVNSLQAFRDSPNFPLFFPQDIHFTPNGHRVYAEVLFTYLIEHEAQFNLEKKI